MDLDQDFIDRWVQPFYMDVLGAKQSLEITEKLIKACDTITPEIVDALLAHLNWRFRKMAAIYAGINGWLHFTDAIGERLLKSEVVYAGQSYCFALARFNSDESVTCLKRYLDIWLNRPECWYDQNHALSALLWLDQVRGSEEAATYLTVNGPWMRFVKNKPNWDLGRTRQNFFDTMTFCQEQFPI